VPGVIRRLARRIARRFSPADERHELVGPPELWRQKRQFQIDFLRTRGGLRPEHSFCDIGSGTLRGGIPVIDYLEPGRYWGLEVRPEVVEQARRELAENHLEHKQPSLLCVGDDLSALELGRSFDRIWAFSVLIHMTDAILEQCVSFVGRHLAPDGVFFANVNLGTAPNRTWGGFPVVSRELDFYQRVAAGHGLEVRPVATLRELGHVTGYANQDAQVMLEWTHASRPSARAASGPAQA
jgi:SAM-dependent methyltransferase